MTLTRIFDSSFCFIKRHYYLCFLIMATAFSLISFLLLKLVTDTEHTSTSTVTMNAMFALSFDFQTDISARIITLIIFRSCWNKKPMIVIILDENILSIFLRISLFILPKWIYVRLLPVHFASQLSLLY